MRGLVNNELRKVLWQQLIDAQRHEQLAEPYAQLAGNKHRDSSVVRVDVLRAPFDLWADGNESKRAQLERLLNAVVNAHSGKSS